MDWRGQRIDLVVTHLGLVVLDRLGDYSGPVMTLGRYGLGVVAGAPS